MGATTLRSSRARTRAIRIPATGKMTRRSRPVAARRSAVAEVVPPTSTVVPGGAAAWAASRSGSIRSRAADEDLGGVQRPGGEAGLQVDEGPPRLGVGGELADEVVVLPEAERARGQGDDHGPADQGDQHRPAADEAAKAPERRRPW